MRVNTYRSDGGHPIPGSRHPPDCPGGVKTEFALGKGRTERNVADSKMLEPTDVASAVLLACTQSPGSRIIEIQMRTMAEGLA